MTTTVFDVPGSVGEALANAWDWDPAESSLEADENFSCGFFAGAEWFAAGMAVCAFLEDLARLHAEQRGPTRACAECGVLRCNHCTGACSLDVCCGGFREVAP